MNLIKAVIAWLFLSSLCMAQTVVGLTGSGAETTLNQQLLAQRQGTAKKSDQKDVVVFIGDRVIPQFVDGAAWKTSVFLVNLENHLVNFQVLFFKDNGSDLYVPVVGQGTVRGLSISLRPVESLQFETTGSSTALAQGWALLSQSTNDSIGGMAIFRQSVPGRFDQEAVVPIVNQFADHFVLLFDNTAFTTAIALANPTLASVTIPVYIRDGSGQIIDQRMIGLGPYSHTAFTLPDTWSSTAGRRGVIEFLTSGFGVGALGLRFSGSAFTSFHVLENLDWVVAQP